jgi:sodium transport system permease protein
MHAIRIIFLKEIKDMLRDRRTILAMVVLPLVLMPVIFTLIANYTLPDNREKLDRKIRVAIHKNNNGHALVERLARRRDIRLDTDISPYEFQRLIKDDSLDFGLILDENFDVNIANGKTGNIEILHKLSRTDTLFFELFAKTIRGYERDILEERLTSIGSSTDILNPIVLDAQNIDPKTISIEEIAGAILPFFFTIFCFMGAVYPAIDLFTGEKERGTIETLLILPTSRLQILTGKLLVVVSAGVISGFLTFLSIYLTLSFHPRLSMFIAVLDWKIFALIFGMMIPLTTFFAGILIPVSIYAKSFKEAQSLIQPMIIVIVIPLMAGLIPGLELNFKTALIPVLNIALASKAIVAGTIDYALLSLVYTALFCLAILGILIARRWFGEESNIFRH